MAHFYGELKGSRGEATRLGTKSSGLRTLAASWEGAVSVRLYEKFGVDWAVVSLTMHHGAGTRRTLYDGPVSGVDTDTLAKQVAEHAATALTPEEFVRRAQTLAQTDIGANVAGQE
jgi:hypothetical protein